MDRSWDLESRLFAEFDKKIALREMQTYNCILLSNEPDARTARHLEDLGVSVFCVNGFAQVCAVASLTNISWNHFIVVCGDGHDLSFIARTIDEFSARFPSISTVVAARDPMSFEIYENLSAPIDIVLELPTDEIRMAFCLMFAAERRRERIIPIRT